MCFQADKDRFLDTDIRKFTTITLLPQVYACSGGGFLFSLILYEATYSAGRNNSVSKVADRMPPIMA